MSRSRPGQQAYRALLTDTWVGTPYYPTSSAAVQGTGTVYASWNGATEVAEWEVLAGASTGDLQVVATHGRTGFETAIELAHTYASYEGQGPERNRSGARDLEAVLVGAPRRHAFPRHQGWRDLESSS